MPPQSPPPQPNMGMLLVDFWGKRTYPVLRKAIAINSQPTEDTFPELPDVLVWIRFVLACIYGSYLGINDITSPVMLLQALNLIAFIPVVYCRLYLGAHSEVFVTETIFSGTFQALALVVLIWMYLFTAQHSEDELRMAALLVMSQSGSDPDMTGSGMVGGTDDVSSSKVIPQEESEF